MLFQRLQSGCLADLVTEKLTVLIEHGMFNTSDFNVSKRLVVLQDKEPVKLSVFVHMVFDELGRFVNLLPFAKFFKYRQSETPYREMGFTYLEECTKIIAGAINPGDLLSIVDFGRLPVSLLTVDAECSHLFD